MDNGRRRMGTRSTSPGGGAAFVRVHPPIHRKTKSQDQRRVSLGAARAFRATNPRHKVGSSPPRDEDQQDSRPVIGWIIDGPAQWAFLFNAQKIAKVLDKYEHKVFIRQSLSDDPDLYPKLARCDIVVCPFAPWLPMLQNHANVVACLKSRKTFD